MMGSHTHPGRKKDDFRVVLSDSARPVAALAPSPAERAFIPVETCPLIIVAAAAAAATRSMLHRPRWTSLVKEALTQGSLIH